MSWVHEGAGYQLLSNRDERLSRAPALAPRIHIRDGVRFIAPLDGDFGGTWIGVNEFGVALCIVNGQVRNGFPQPHPSRGLVVFGLLSSVCCAEVIERLEGADLSAVAPFALVCLEPRRKAAVAEWNGDELAVFADANQHMPLVSSSFDSEGAQAARREELARIVRAAEHFDAVVLGKFHRSHGAAPSAYSPCMHRPGAETVSFTQVCVNGSEAALSYMPAAPCRAAAAQKVVLSCRSSF